MGYKKFLRPGSSEWVTRNSWEKLSTFSPDSPVKDSWEFPWIPRKDSWEFPRIFRKLVTWDSYHGLTLIKVDTFVKIMTLVSKLTHVSKLQTTIVSKLTLINADTFIKANILYILIHNILKHINT